MIQGGADLILRRQCADALIDIGFDGFGYGGWPLDQVDYLNRFFTCCGIRGQATASDITATPPVAHADLALMFKILPLLDRLPYTNTRTFLHTVNADHMVVSFPTRSLGGKEKGMASHYEQLFLEMMDDSWEVERMVFETELVFVVQK
ncbi:MAG: hypothetical protein VYA69_11000 [Gemmatimonadota bacterium]|nr:hypothetical protein [Gemmatimonadota bacterium]